MPTLRKCKNPECGIMLEYWSRKFYCTNACKQQHYRARTTPHYNVSKNPYRKKCRNCGKSFTSKTPLAEYCTRGCKQDHYRQRKRIEAKNPQPIQTVFPDESYTISNAIT